MVSLDGSMLIGGAAFRQDATFVVTDRTTGAKLDPAFSQASSEDVDQACRLASHAFDDFRGTPLERRAFPGEDRAEYC